jgi:ankyrin repeat protein
MTNHDPTRHERAHDSLPDRPNLRYLKELAKARLKAGESPTHADALHAVARRFGFESWPKLKAHVEAVSIGGRAERVAAFLDASVPRPRYDHRAGNLDRAEALLAIDAGLADADIYTAAVTGNAEAVRRRLGADPALATTPGGPRGWVPLLYACFSRYLRLQRDEREAGFAGVVDELLAAGADPDAYFWNPDDPEGYERCLYGAAGVAVSASITERLIAAGATINDAEVAYHIVESDDHRCLKPWLAAAPNAEMLVIAVQHKIDYMDPAGLRLILEAGADPNAISRWGHATLHMVATRNQTVETAQLLLEFGADPTVRDRAGKSAFALAARFGRGDLLTLYRERGFDDDSLTPADRLIAACAEADRAGAEAILAANPGLVESFAERDHWAIAEMAKAGRAEAVQLMLDLGFNRDAGEHGYTALHWAALKGYEPIVDLLLAAGADPGVRDPNYRSPVWGWAEHGGHPELARRIAQGVAADNIFAAVWLDDAAAVDAQLAADPARADAFDGWTTPLIVAAANGRTAIAEALIAAGADVNRPTAQGITPMQAALDANHDDLAELLALHGGVAATGVAADAD